MCYKYVCLVLLSTPLSYTANILALVPAISYSHHVAYAPLWTALSLRGHNVTLLTTNPTKDPKLTNLTELDINWAYQFIKNLSNRAEFEITMWNFHTELFYAMDLICKEVLTSEIGKILLDNKSNKFDLVLAENVCPEFLAFANIYNCPKILISTMSLSSIFYNILGDFTHPVTHPEFVVPFHGNLNFKERIISTITTLYLHYKFAYVFFPKKQKVLHKYFNSPSTVTELIRDIDLLFLNVNPNIHGPKAVGPATIIIGGHRDDLSSEPMPVDIKKYLDDAKEGCILISLGGNIKSSDLSWNILKPMVDALAEVPYKVLWKFEVNIDGMPKNIKTAKWLPQQQILNHQNLKLFVCHGGLQSIEESIYSEVPFVMIPFFADQDQNAMILEHKGVAIVLDKNTINKNQFKNAILNVMTDKKYYERVKKLKRLILDEPMTGLEKAVWWTEYVIRNKGAKHLKNPAADIPLYQYFLLDVLGFLLLIVIFIAKIVLLTLKKISKLFWRFHHLKQKSQ